jgi:hypothetical protein
MELTRLERLPLVSELQFGGVVCRKIQNANRPGIRLRYRPNQQDLPMDGQRNGTRQFLQAGQRSYNPPSMAETEQQQCKS